MEFAHTPYSRTPPTFLPLPSFLFIPTYFAPGVLLMAGPPFLASPLVLQVAMSAPLSPSLVSLLIPFSLVLIPLLPTVSLNFIRPLVILTGLLPGGLSSYFLQTDECQTSIGKLPMECSTLQHDSPPSVTLFRLLVSAATTLRASNIYSLPPLKPRVGMPGSGPNSLWPPLWPPQLMFAMRSLAFPVMR